MVDLPPYIPSTTPRPAAARAAEAPKPVLVATPPDPVPPPPAPPQPPTEAPQPRKFLTRHQLIALERELQKKRNGTRNGQAPSYDPIIADGICRDIAAGMSFRLACEERQLSPSGVWTWRQKYPAFAAAYREALDVRMDHYVHEIEDIADNEKGDVKRDTLRVDSRKWIASKLAPKRYGERLQIDAGDPLERYRGMTDGQRLQEARALVDEARRVLEQAREDGITIDGEFTREDD